jgi:hypothetical protein
VSPPCNEQDFSSKEKAMTSSSLKDNGRLPRKTLSSQLDRLDQILDGLADSLNDAVAGAAREGVLQVVREAVQDAVHDALASVPPPSPAATPSPGSTNWKEKLKAAWAWLKAAVAGVAVLAGSRVRRWWAWGLDKFRKLLIAPGGWWQKLAQGCRRAGDVLAQLTQFAWQHRTLAGVALGVGLATALGSYLAGPLTASLLSGLCSTALAAGGLAALSLWRLLGAVDET